MRAVLVRDDDRFVSLRSRIRQGARAQGGHVRLDPCRLGARSQRRRLVGLRAVAARRERRGGAVARGTRERRRPDRRRVARRQERRAGLGAARRHAEGERQQQRRGRRNRYWPRCAASRSVHRPRVQHAGFVVLKSPDIPSVLVETAFISNVADERRLQDPVHQLKIAEAIHHRRARLLLRAPAAGHARRGAGRGATRGGREPARTARRDAESEPGVCYPRGPHREGPPHAHPGPARTAHSPDRGRRGRRTSGVGRQGAGREQSRCRRAHASRSTSRPAASRSAACATTAPGSRATSWRWRSRITRPARSRASRTSSRCARSGSAARRCRRSPRCRGCGSISRRAGADGRLRA